MASPVPRWLGLLDELDIQPARGVVDERLGHPLATVAHHHHDPVDVELGQRVEHVQDHRSAAQPVQGLGAVRAHPGPLAGGQDDGGQRLGGHGPILPPPGPGRRARAIRTGPGHRTRVVAAGPAGSGPGTVRVMAEVDYDEFGLFSENAEEFGLPYEGPPAVRRTSVAVGPDRRLSALVWGTKEPELVLLHGGAQNAHTWDTVALALDRPLVAVDLPGHGHSDGGPAGSLSVQHHGTDLAVAVGELAPRARAVVGMSLGGLSALALADQAPGLVRRLVLVDITPGVTTDKAAAVTAFIDGPPSFASFDDILARTVEHNPTRSVSSLRRGILHNAVQLEDGSWVWRYARFRDAESSARPEFGDLWAAVSSLRVPVLLVRGMAPGSVVDDADEAELVRRVPGAQVERVEGAGHSVQGDRPVELARLLEAFVG